MIWPLPNTSKKIKIDKEGIEKILQQNTMVINKPVHLMCQHNSQWHTLRSLISSITVH